MGDIWSYFSGRLEDRGRQIEEGNGSQQHISRKGYTADQAEGGNRHLSEDNIGLHQQVFGLKLQIKNIEFELEDKTKRLSAYLSAQVSADERHLENIGETVRPSSLGKRYQQLESTEWVSAKEQMDNNNSIPSHDALRLLCFLMDAAFNAARPEVTRREAEILNMLLSPVLHQIPSSNGINGIPERPCSPDPKGLVPTVISQSLKNEVLKCMKKTSHFIDLSGLEDNVKVKAAERFALPEGFFVSHDEAQKYVKACCRLAWQLHLVQPPMVVTTEPTAYDKKIHNLWYECSDDTNSEIQDYIWPILYYYEGGGVAAKGRVMLSKFSKGHDESETTVQEI